MKTGEECKVATTSIWSVKGWLGKVVIYVENPEKTTAPEIANFRDMKTKGRYSVRKNAEPF